MKLVSKIASVAALSAGSFTIAHAAEAQGGAAHGSPLVTLLPLVVIVLVFIFMFRSQSKRSKEQKRMLSSVSKGDEVMTAGGVFGEVVKVNDTTVELKVAEDVVIKFQKSSVANVLPKGTVKQA